MELFLIRHPEPDVPEGTCYGRSDIGLAGDAGTEAARLRDMLPEGIPVYTSPLLRCRSVAEHLSPTPTVDARLVEMHFGEWEMRRWDEIEKAAFDAWVADILNFAPPGGESAAEMLARTLSFLDELRSGEAPAAPQEYFLGRGEPRPQGAAVVTHGGVLRVLFAHWLEVPPRRWPRLVFEFGAVSKVVLGKKDIRVEYLNRK
jgi:alpha-ribazole phosphatase